MAQTRRCCCTPGTVSRTGTHMLCVALASVCSTCAVVSLSAVPRLYTMLQSPLVSQIRWFAWQFSTVTYCADRWFALRLRRGGMVTLRHDDVSLVPHHEHLCAKG